MTIKFVRPQSIVGEGLTIVSDSDAQEGERESLRRLSEDDFRRQLKAVKGNPEAEKWLKENSALYRGVVVQRRPRCPSSDVQE